MLTVKDLIKILQKYPKDLVVVYEIHSEQVLLEESDLSVQELCEARPDGWVQDKRDDKPSKPYLVFP